MSTCISCLLEMRVGMSANSRVASGELQQDKMKLHLSVQAGSHIDLSQCLKTSAFYHNNCK